MNFANEELRKHHLRFQELVKNGQQPKTLFIGCSDSRVVPNLITNTKPGELFVVRNIGNFVPPFSPNEDFHATAAVIEYAVSVLEVEEIVVCGHSHCGAINSLFKPKNDNPDLLHVNKWLELGQKPKEFGEGLDLSQEERIIFTEKYSTLFQLENLLTYPAVKRRVDEDKLHLNAWYYVMEEGKILEYDFEKEDFIPM